MSTKLLKKKKKGKEKESSLLKRPAVTATQASSLYPLRPLIIVYVWKFEKACFNLEAMPMIGNSETNGLT